jgi:hypothetical protein
LTKKIDDPNSFKGRGFSFIPVRAAHLDFLGFIFDEEPPPIAECFGNTMVDRDFMPLGFALLWIRPEGSVTVHAHYGPWLRMYPKDILRAMKGTMDQARAVGITEVWAIADERVPGSRTLVAWFNGEPSGQRVEGQGEYYRLDLTKSKI